MRRYYPVDRPPVKLQASHIYRDLKDLVWPRRHLFLLGLILVFINRAASLVLPSSTKYLIDHVVQHHMGGRPIRYYEANKTGALVSRIMSDVEGVRNLVGTGLVELIGGLFTAIISFVLLIRINATLTFVALGFLLVFGVVLQRAFKSIRPIFRERGKINAEVTGRLTE